MDTLWSSLSVSSQEIWTICLAPYNDWIDAYCDDGGNKNGLIPFVVSWEMNSLDVSKNVIQYCDEDDMNTNDDQCSNREISDNGRFV